MLNINLLNMDIPSFDDFPINRQFTSSRIFDEENNFFEDFSHNNEYSLENYGDQNPKTPEVSQSPMKIKENQIIDFFTQDNYGGFEDFSQYQQDARKLVK